MQNGTPQANQPASPPTPQELLALPLALMLAAIFVSIDGIPSILAWLGGMAFHELGHALVFWLRSIVAVPVFAFTAPLHSETSFFVFAVFLALGVWGIKNSNRAGYRFLSVTIAVFLALLCCFSLIIPTHTSEMIMIYGGLGGELYLATLGMVLFYQPMPKRFNWNVNRYLVLGLSAISFCAAAHRWYQAQRDTSKLPMGALLDFGALTNDSNESSGDLDRLIREFGWSVESIVSTYTATTLVCIAILIGYYFHICFVAQGARR